MVIGLVDGFMCSGLLLVCLFYGRWLWCWLYEVSNLYYRISGIGYWCVDWVWL